NRSLGEESADAPHSLLGLHRHQPDLGRGAGDADRPPAQTSGGIYCYGSNRQPVRRDPLAAGGQPAGMALEVARSFAGVRRRPDAVYSRRGLRPAGFGPAGLGVVDQAGGGIGVMSGDREPPMLTRVLEPEVMDSPQEAADYDAMDHQAVNRVFVDDFLAAANGAGLAF